MRKFLYASARALSVGRWESGREKLVVPTVVAVALIAIGAYIYFNMDEEVFKHYLIAVLTTASMIYWHLGKPARIKINGEEGVVIA